MFGFLFHNKREEVHRVLHGRVNRAQARSITAANMRGPTRGTFTEVVWVVPCESPAKADFTKVFPALTRDLSTQGISIVHSAPITDPCVIIGLKDETDRRFLVCTPKHCTSLGYGFHHIGMLAEAVLTIDREDFNAMLEAMLKFEVTAESAELCPLKVVG